MESKETNITAIIGFGLSIATWILPMYIFFAIAGLITSIIGLTQTNARGQSLLAAWRAQIVYGLQRRQTRGAYLRASQPHT